MPVSKEKLLKLQNNSKLREELNLSIRWRVLTTKGGKARIVAYQDARDVQLVLDHVCGPQNWSNEPRSINNNLFMVIGINTEEEGWVYKADVGMEANIGGAKGEASDALKRAAVVWGVFRDIYMLDYIVLDAKGQVPYTKEGQPLMTAEAITLYCNGLNSSMGHLINLYKSIKDKLNGRDDVNNALKLLKNFINE